MEIGGLAVDRAAHEAAHFDAFGLDAVGEFSEPPSLDSDREDEGGDVLARAPGLDARDAFER